MMIHLDKYAIISRLALIDPVVKTLYFFLFFTIALLSGKILFLFIFATALIALSCWNTRIRVFKLLHLLAFPMGFVFIGCLPMCFTCSGVPVQGLLNFGIASAYFSVAPHDLWGVLFIIVRSFAMISALFFLILSTPVSQIIEVMKKCRVPEVFTEHVILIYRSIFIILSVTTDIYTSQKSRLGYMGWNNSRRTFASLIGRVLILSFNKAEIQWNSIESRCFGQSFHFLPLPYRTSKRIWFGWICAATILLSLLYITNHMELT